MRSHSDIVKAVGPAELAVLTDTPISTVRSWAQRDSIPSNHWMMLVAKGHATAAELMAAKPPRAVKAA